MASVIETSVIEVPEVLSEPPSDKKFIITLIIPAIVLFGIAILFPVVTGILISFTDSSAQTGYFGRQVTIINYYELLLHPGINGRNFWQYLYQTLFFSVISPFSSIQTNWHISLCTSMPIYTSHHLLGGVLCPGSYRFRQTPIRALST